MKFTRFLVTLALLVSVTGVASAQVGSLSLWWDACSSTATPALNLNKQFAGPGIYKQILSAAGTEDVSQGWEFAIKISAAGPAFPDAWRFESGGCNLGQLAMATTGLSKACPTLQGGRPLPLFQYDYNNAVSGPNRAVLQAFSAYDPFDPVGATNYTVAQLSYDHSFSATGPQDPAIACGNAQFGMCHHITRHGFLDANNIVVNWPVGNEFVLWNDAQNSSQCPGATPATPSTWGKIKSTYHN